LGDHDPVAHRIAFLDVFAERPLAGNGLAVIADADDVTDEVMLAVARETRLSETTFVQSPSADGADYRNRIFTVEREIPFAGHPSLGTAVAVARSRSLREASFVQQTEAGLQPIDVRADGDRFHASMLQGAAEFGPELDPAATMAAAGLGHGDAHPKLPPQVVSTGLPALIAPVSGAEAVARARPDLHLIDALLGTEESPSFYLVWWDPDAERARARMFASGVAGGEDPATGSAAGPLCAYLAERAGAERVVISQGEEMGRPSRLEAEMEGGRPRVGGTVIPLIEGEIALPAGNSA
jgi:trans-2,3-dihydro-3-hydroxyanthranilate isomerase